MLGTGQILPHLEAAYAKLLEGGPPLDAALAVLSEVEADPEGTGVGLGGLPNEAGVVQLDAACMDGATHNAGGVAALENILHPVQVARYVMERTDHCLLAGRGAYEFARDYGFPHTELLTEKARGIWQHWLETKSPIDFRLPPGADRPQKDGGREGKDERDEETGAIPDFSDDPDGALARLDPARGRFPFHGTAHCSVLAKDGDVACATTTSGRPFKLKGRVGDSPLLGAGLYCDNEVGSVGSAGRGEAAMLSSGSFAILELMRQGASPKEAGLEVLQRVVRQTERQAAWQPGLLDEDGRPSFGLIFYVVHRSGEHAGVTLRGGGSYSVADGDGARHEELVPLLP
jgi:N4-(beta-N-acetylglucosaminyl)-L-asparaginase